MPRSDPSPSRELDVARAAAASAAAVLLEGWGKRPAFHFKSRQTDLVTELDRRAETIILAELAAAFPDDGIVGEEGSAKAGRSGRAFHQAMPDELRRLA
jgi:myo-inositol-1(or 4)-monophosphatase